MRVPPAQRDTAAARLSVRLQMVLVLLIAGALALAARAVDLQLMNHSFLLGQGDARYSRVAEISAHRGTITDRYGEPLAVSTPVDSVWVNPKELSQTADQLPRLARALKREPQSLARRVSSNVDREFLYLARHLQPEQAARIRMLDIPGVYLLREYRRYYPAGEVSGHILGFTSIDDSGQEGLELAYDHWLAGEDGAKRVIQDRYGHVVENVESIRAARPGKDLVLSLDLRIQYLAYRELKRALLEHRARSGSLVVLDIATGEVLAMVNQPAFNPNARDQLAAGRYRNRAVTDIFEPGSSIKPFIVAAALASGRFHESSVINTDPGFIKVGVKVIEDKHDLGAIDIATVLAKSSNVAMAKIALALDPQQIWTTLNGLGFGQVTTSGYPGESAGLLSNHSHWRPIGVATLSYGYGLSVTPLQLAQAYATLGAGGIRRPVTFLRVDSSVGGERVLDERVARQLIHLLESVIAPEGTGVRASLTGYRVAGKTGTAWKSTTGGYSTDKYISTFAGVVPASAPRLAAVVMIYEPSGRQYYGGDVAAPVFAGVMSGALRLMAIAPDDLRRVPEATLAQAEVEP
jgi:cell division protein FtsI (penicillin-binding protein 3)